MADSEHKAAKMSRVSMMTMQKTTSKSVSDFMGKSMSRLRFRKQSYGFLGVPGIRPVERMSCIGFEFKRPPLVYLPTYQLDPRKPFHLESITKVVEEMIDENFEGHKYNPQESPALAMRLASELMRKVKLNQDRYRIISVVTIGQKRSQSFSNALAFLWDHERDNYVESHRETATAFIQITLFAIYLD